MWASLSLYCFEFVELLRWRDLMQISLMFEKFMAISSNILSSSFVLSFHPRIPIIHMYPYHVACIISFVSHKSLRLCSFLFTLLSFCCLDWIILIDPSSSSLILPSANSNLLWAPLFFIFKARISIWFFLKKINFLYWYIILMLTFNSLGMVSFSPLITFITAVSCLGLVSLHLHFLKGSF